MKVGQKVVRTPASFADPERTKSDPPHKPMSGTVVYIHPKGRFHTVEFQLPLGAVRESFAGVKDG